MRRGCRERFPHHQYQRKPLVSDPGMHHGTCVAHVPWCMSGSLTRDGRKNVPGIPGACATHNFTYLARGPWTMNNELYFMLFISLLYETHVTPMMTSSNGIIFRVTGHLCGEFTGHKGQWRGALMFSLICVWINGWVNNGEAGDLRRYRAHYGVTVMLSTVLSNIIFAHKMR